MNNMKNKQLQGHRNFHEEDKKTKDDIFKGIILSPHQHFKLLNLLTQEYDRTVTLSSKLMKRKPSVKKDIIQLVGITDSEKSELESVLNESYVHLINLIRESLEFVPEKDEIEKMKITIRGNNVKDIISKYCNDSGIRMPESIKSPYEFAIISSKNSDYEIYSTREISII